jgi:ParB family chromosome partitioning protein
MPLLKNVASRVGTQGSGPLIKDIPLGEIHIKENVRSDYSGIVELAETIRQYGLQQPIMVYRNGEEYAVKTGHRRFKAYELLYAKEPDRFHSIRCIVSDEKDVAVIQLIENVQREDLSQQDLYKALVRFREQGMTHKQIAEIMGKSEKFINNLFIGVNEITNDEKLLDFITPAGGRILDVAETKGVPAPQRLELLDERGKGNLSRKELRQKSKSLKEVAIAPVPKDETATLPQKQGIRAVIDPFSQELILSLVDKGEDHTFAALLTNILLYLRQTKKYTVIEEYATKDGRVLCKTHQV